MDEKMTEISSSSAGGNLYRRIVVGVMIALLAISGVTLGQPREAHAQGGDLVAGIMAGATAAGVEVGTATAQFAADNIDKVCPGGQEDLVNCAVAFAQLGTAADECYGEAQDEGGEDGGPDLKTFTDCLGDNGFGMEPEEEEKDTEETTDFSMYRVASSVSAMYFNALSPFSEEEREKEEDKADDANSGEESNVGTGGKDKVEDMDVLLNWESILSNPSSAASFMGYPDADHAVHDRFIFSGGGSTAEVTYSHGSLSAPGSADAVDSGGVLGAAAGGDSGANSNDIRPDVGVADYALFGSTLAGMGLDSTGTRSDAASPMSQVMGGSMMIAYVLSGAVDTIFDSVVSALRFLNPFSFIVDAVAEETNPSFTAGMASEQNDDGLFDPLKEFIGTIYRGALQVGWMVTIPVFLGVMVGGAMFMRRYDLGKGAKQMVIRMMFLVIGLPLLGVTYTGALDSIGGGPDSRTSSNATKVVLSTYVDFESWATKARLGIPQGDQIFVEWDTEKGGPSDAAEARARQTALGINTMSFNPQWASLADSSVGSENGSGWIGSMSEEEKVDASAADAFTQTVEMLTRYLKGQQVSATDYASDVQGAMIAESRQGSEEKKAAIKGWYEQLLDPKSMAAMESDDIQELNNPLIQVQEGFGFSAEPNGEGVYRFKTNGEDSRNNCYASVVIQGGDVEKPLTMCNMAPLGMYNYLNTSFTNAGGTMYSADKAVSLEARQQHNSVSAVGSGAMRGVYWLSSMSLLGSFVVIGLFYAIALLIGSIKRAFSLLTSIPFATMGLLPAIAKVVVHTAALFIEILGTLFLYKIVQEFMMVLPGMFEQIFMKGLDSNESMAAAGAAATGILALGMKSPVTTVLVITLITTAGIIFMTFMAVKFRSSMIGAVDDALTRLVNKLTDSQVSSGAEGGGTMRQGLAKGAGLAATHAMLNSGSAGGEEATEISDGSEAATAGGVGGAAAGAGIDGAAGDISGEGGMAGVDAEGNLVDAEGNALVDAEGNPIDSSEMMDVDANGNLVGADGNPMLDGNGEPIPGSSVGGIGPDGQLYDSAGKPILDGDGNAAMANGAGLAAASAGGQLLSDEAMAQQVAAQGGLSAPGESGVMGEGAEVGAGVGSGGPEMATASLNTAPSQGESGVGGMSGSGDGSRQFGSVASASVGSALGAAAVAGGGSATAAASASQAAAAMPSAVSGLQQQATQFANVHAPEGFRPVDGHVPNTGGSSAPPAGPAGPVAQPRFSGAPIQGAAGAPGAPAAPGYQPVASHAPMGDGNSGFGSTARIVGASMAGGAVSNLVNGPRRSSNINESINGGKGGGGKRRDNKPGMGQAMAGGAASAALRGMGGPNAATMAHLYGQQGRGGAPGAPGGSGPKAGPQPGAEGPMDA